MAIFLAILRANAVLPIPGRAATMIKSDFCHPDVTLSNFVNPDGTPLKPSSFCLKTSILSRAPLMRVLILS